MFEESDDERVRRAIIDTVVESYDVIAQAQEANRSVENVSGAAQSEADKLRESLIKLQAQSQSVMQVGGVWRRRKQILSSAVAQHQKLLALAEAPSLVEECIRGEMYHEALLVMEHMLRSGHYAQEEVGFFVRTNHQIRAALERSLEEVVLPRLSGPLSLDAAFKIATFLRRLGTSMERLRVLFLERRSVYLDRLVAEANSSPVAYSRILKYINVYKVHVSEAVMQYSACFPTASARTTTPSTRDGVDAWDEDLAQWCHAQAQRFVAAFGATLREITNGSELALIVEQCSSCSTNVAKLHADVAPLVNHLMTERVKEVFASHMAHAQSAYAASMRTFSWRLPPSYSHSGPTAHTTGPSLEPPSAPPLVLAQWLPLAYAMNGLLSALNAVRKCLLPGVEVFCGQHVEQLVGRITADLIRDGELASTMEVGERAVYDDLLSVFVSAFYPHALQCSRKLLGAEVTRAIESALEEDMERLSRRLSVPQPSSADAAPAPAPTSAPPAPAPAVPVPAPMAPHSPQPPQPSSDASPQVSTAPAQPIAPITVAQPAAAPAVTPPAMMQPQQQVQSLPQSQPARPATGAVHNPFAHPFVTPHSAAPSSASASAPPQASHPSQAHGQTQPPSVYSYQSGGAV